EAASSSLLRLCCALAIQRLDDSSSVGGELLHVGLASCPIVAHSAQVGISRQLHNHPVLGRYALEHPCSRNIFRHDLVAGQGCPHARQGEHYVALVAFEIVEQLGERVDDSVTYGLRGHRRDERSCLGTDQRAAPAPRCMQQDGQVRIRGGKIGRAHV